MKQYWQYFEERWREKCKEPCIGNWGTCRCRQWAASQFARDERERIAEKYKNAD
jgi:hypothetical protein